MGLWWSSPGARASSAHVSSTAPTSYRIVNLDLTGDPESDPDVDFICTDLTSDTSVSRAVERIDRHHGSHVASVVRLATFYDLAGEDSPVYDEVTVQGPQRLLDGRERLHVHQFVFSSTMLVHKPTRPGDPIEEDDPIKATWPHPESKLEWIWGYPTAIGVMLMGSGLLYWRFRKSGWLRTSTHSAAR